MDSDYQFSDVQALQAMGFTDYESRAYAALLAGPGLNGYRLSQRAGIPRANVYAVLDKLVHRGAVLRVDRDDGPRYSAVEPTQLLAEIEARQRQALDEARHALARLSRHQGPPPVFNLSGEAWLPQARRLIAAAEKSLLIAIQPNEAATLAGSLSAARERGATITTLCLEACPGNCGYCLGDVHCYRLQSSGGERWLVLAADARRVLVARFEESRVEAILTDQPLLVRLACAYIQQSLTLALLGGELADRFEGLLSVETRRLLDRLSPQGDFVAWLKTVEQSGG